MSKNTNVATHHRWWQTVENDPRASTATFEINGIERRLQLQDARTLDRIRFDLRDGKGNLVPPMVELTDAQVAKFETYGLRFEAVKEWPGSFRVLTPFKLLHWWSWQ